MPLFWRMRQDRHRQMGVRLARARSLLDTSFLPRDVAESLWRAANRGPGGLPRHRPSVLARVHPARRWHCLYLFITGVRVICVVWYGVS